MDFLKLNYVLVFLHPPLIYDSIILIVSKILIFNMSKFGIIKETFQIYLYKRKFHMFPIIILLIALIGVTALAQSGLVAFIYPI